MMSDNITAVSTVSHMGTGHSQYCNRVARDIWLWAITKNVWLSAAHILGKINCDADSVYRQLDNSMEWMLQATCFL